MTNKLSIAMKSSLAQSQKCTLQGLVGVQLVGHDFELSLFIILFLRRNLKITARNFQLFFHS